MRFAVILKDDKKTLEQLKLQIAAEREAATEGTLKKANDLYWYGKMINENDFLIEEISLVNDELLVTREKKFATLDDEKIKNSFAVAVMVC